MVIHGKPNRGNRWPLINSVFPILTGEKKAKLVGTCSLMHPMSLSPNPQREEPQTQGAIALSERLPAAGKLSLEGCCF